MSLQFTEASDSRTVIAIDLTRRDVFLATVAMMFVSPQQRWMFLGMSVVCSFFISDDLASFLFMSVVLWITGLFGGTIFAAVNTLFNPRLARGILGEHSFTVSDEGLYEETAFNKTLHKWASLDRVTEVFGMLLIRVAGSTWHVIPVRSFKSNEEARAFASDIRAQTSARGN